MDMGWAVNSQRYW